MPNAAPPTAAQPPPGAQPTSAAEPRRRADARDNAERILAAAAAVFARDGAAATLKDIARQAGVGIGTLYRHFPDRQALVDAVHRTETDRLCAAAPALLRAHPPVEALRRWTTRFLDYMATKEGMSDALHAILAADDDRRLATRVRLTEALASLIEAGQRAGDLRAELEVADVLLALGGFAMVVDVQRVGRATGERLVDILLAGVRAAPAPGPTTKERDR